MELVDIKNHLRAQGVKFYHEEDAGIIINADCMDILPKMPEKCVDLVLTDPPYENFKHFKYIPIDRIRWPDCRMFIFWSASNNFPLDHSAIHIWHKPNGRSSEYYERIFEIRGNAVYKVFRYGCIDSDVAANMLQDKYYNHPTQKPIRLIRQLISMDKGIIILDPFLGSGTTAVAAKQLGRQFIGIEIEEKYCRIARQRLSQEVMAL